MQFITPSIITDIELLSRYFFCNEIALIYRPVTYILFQATPIDGQNHHIQIYFDTTGEISVNTVGEEIVWNRVENYDNLEIMRMGTSTQNVLGNSGDAVGIGT